MLFLLSGGGSALFEQPLVPGEELQDITNQLLASGADIVEMNTIRKRLSAVKGGRFAQACAPAKVFSIVLSDILEDPLDMIASGPAVPDSSTCAQALAIAEKYYLNLSEQAKALLAQETPKALDNVTTQITGSVRELCTAAAKACRELGYEPILLTDQLCCEAKEAGSFLGSIARTHAEQGKKLAFIAGGETVVHPDRQGSGRPQSGACTGRSSGAGGTERRSVLRGQRWHRWPHRCRWWLCGRRHRRRTDGKGLERVRHPAKQRCLPRLAGRGGLIITGATGTNVNDVAVALIGEKNMKVIDAHVHLVQCIAGTGAGGEMRSIGGGQGMYADGPSVSSSRKGGTPSR